jgi:hypothetical protein
LPRAVAKFIVSDWGDKVNSGTWLSYRPARLHRLAGRCDNPMPESAKSPVRDNKFGYWQYCPSLKSKPGLKVLTDHSN